jgi:hypothetical protein
VGILRDHFERIRQTLLSKAAEAGVLDHGTSKGTARELLVSEFLESSLPREYDFVGGEITTADGTRSGQIDVMMLPKSAPQFSLAPKVSLGLVHAVVAVIEVKSTLTTAPLTNASELRNALETVRALRALPIDPPLDPWPWTANRRHGGGCVRLDHIPACIVAFDGPTMETVADWLCQWASTNRSAMPNTITCLKRNYTLVLNDGWLFIPELLPPDSQTALYLKNEHSCLADLFDYLMKVVQAWSYARPRTPLVRYV